LTGFQAAPVAFETAPAASLAARNREIGRRYAQGESIEELAERYHLSVHTIRKVVRGTRRESLRGRKRL